MDFEALQQSWRSQPLDMPADSQQLKSRVIDEWQKQQRKLMRGNIFTSIAFIGVFITIGWVYSSFHAGRTLFFSGSLLLMSVLMLVYLWVLWRGLAYQKTDPAIASVDYIDRQLSKLRWRRKTLTSYVWVYSSLLWLAFMFYCIDITTGGSLLLRIGAPAVITIYIFGMQLVMKKTAQRKQLAKLDALMADLQALKDSMVTQP